GNFSSCSSSTSSLEDIERSNNSESITTTSATTPSAADELYKKNEDEQIAELYQDLQQDPELRTLSDRVPQLIHVGNKDEQQNLLLDTTLASCPQEEELKTSATSSQAPMSEQSTDSDAQATNVDEGTSDSDAYSDGMRLRSEAARARHLKAVRASVFAVESESEASSISQASPSPATPETEPSSRMQEQYGSSMSSPLESPGSVTEASDYTTDTEVSSTPSHFGFPASASTSCTRGSSKSSSS
ncbi:unnamed protein product, partial [Amoebophrya sp. A25]